MVDVKMSISGFGLSHNFKDADGRVQKFSMRYKFISAICPKCKVKSKFLFPALNQCTGCRSLLAFCVLNDGENRIGLWDVLELNSALDKGDSSD